MPGIATFTETAGTTLLTERLGFRCTAIMLRAKSDNTANITVSINPNVPASSSTTIVRAGENITIDITEQLILKKLLGMQISDDDFINVVSYISTAAAQTLYVDAYEIPMGTQISDYSQ